MAAACVCLMARKEVFTIDQLIEEFDMSLQAEITPIEKFEVKIGGKSIGVFEKDSSWEGMVKLRNRDGVIIINVDRSDIGKFLSSLIETGETRDFTVIKISPSLLPEKEGKA